MSQINITEERIRLLLVVQAARAADPLSSNLIVPNGAVQPAQDQVNFLPPFLYHLYQKAQRGNPSLSLLSPNTRVQQAYLQALLDAQGYTEVPAHVIAPDDRNIMLHQLMLGQQGATLQLSQQLQNPFLASAIGTPPLAFTSALINPNQLLAQQQVGSAGNFSITDNQSRAKRQKTGDEPSADLPTVLALPEDYDILSTHQIFLRHQIEAFRASEEDVSTHKRGRNKPVNIGQIGIRCRHCAHLHVGKRQKGSAYFPASLLGLYQSAQNMCTTHMQCGLCSEMPLDTKQQFARLLSINSGYGAGRPYWASAAMKLGLVDTEDGIRYDKDLIEEKNAGADADVADKTKD